MTDVYLGDIGVEFRIDTESTITSATTAYIDIIRPDGSAGTWSATTYDETTLTFTLGTSTGKAFISTSDPPGDWVGQAHVVLGAGSTITLTGAPFIISVGEPL